MSETKVQSVAVVKGPGARLAVIRAELGKAMPSLSQLLPPHIKADRMLRVITSAVSKTPDLQVCDPKSIVLAAAQAFALGLEPNTALGLGYLVPFKGTCTFIPGYRGLQRLAVQSGEVQIIQARAVYKRDAFEVHYGTSPRIEHSPYLEGDHGPLIAVYAVAIMKSGVPAFDVMTIGEVNAIRDRSKSAGNGPWVSDFDEMAKKTVIRRLCKTLPLSEEKLAKALEHQARAEAGDAPDFSDIIDVAPELDDEPEPTRTESLSDRLQAKVAS
jgi:recombination protein RecT